MPYFLTYDLYFGGIRVLSKVSKQEIEDYIAFRQGDYRVKATIPDRLALKKLRGLKTLEQGHDSDLKIQNEFLRIWLSRLTVEDGQPYDNQVVVEMLLPKKIFPELASEEVMTWQKVDTYEAR